MTLLKYKVSFGEITTPLFWGLSAVNGPVYNNHYFFRKLNNLNDECIHHFGTI